MKKDAAFRSQHNLAHSFRRPLVPLDARNQEGPFGMQHGKPQSG